MGVIRAISDNYPLLPLFPPSKCHVKRSCVKAEKGWKYDMMTVSQRWHNRMRGQQFVMCSDLCTLGLERRDRTVTYNRKQSKRFSTVTATSKLFASVLPFCLFFFSAFFSAKLQVALFQRSISGKVLFQSKQLL